VKAGDDGVCPTENPLTQRQTSMEGDNFGARAGH
jgi:hypothetical protein